MVDDPTPRNFDFVTDQTAAHDPLNGYVPAGLSVEEADHLRADDPEEYLRRASESIARHVEGMLEYVRIGSYVFDYGNNLRGEAEQAGVTEAFSYPGFVPAYIRPLFCRGIGPFRWAVLSGDPEDIAAIDGALRGLFPDDRLLQRWLDLAPERVAFQGLPGEDLLARLRRSRQGRPSDQRPRPERPGVRARGHWPRPPGLGLGGVPVPGDRGDGGRLRRDRRLADPERARQHGRGATWVSVHHGGGVGIGNSIHAGMVVVADGTDDAAERLERVLTTDPGTGVLRHADAGYDEAKEAAREHGLESPRRLARA